MLEYSHVNVYRYLKLPVAEGSHHNEYKKNGKHSISNCFMNSNACLIDITEKHNVGKYLSNMNGDLMFK